MSILGRFWRHIRDRTRRHFLTGLLVTVPLALTYFVVSAIVVRMDRILAILPPRFHPDTYLPFRIPGLGVIVTLVIIQVVGLLATNLFGRSIVKAYEVVLEKIPLVRTLYVAVKQLLEQILSADADRFRRVVLVEYPRRGIYSLGFVTGPTRGDVEQAVNQQTLNVFIPTTPNPTSGYYLVVPESQTISLDMGVDQAFKIVMSAGIVGEEATKQRARPNQGRAPPAGSNKI